MVIKIFYLFVAFFSVLLMLIMVQSPYISANHESNLKIADMQMRGISDYEISQESISACYKADRWQKFGKKNDFFDFDSVILKDERIHKLSSKKAHQIDDTITLYGDAIYQNDKNLTFSSQEIIYDMKNNFVSSNLKFKATQYDNILNGNGIFYDIKNGKINANSIHSTLQIK